MTCAFACCFVQAHAQQTRISGKVTDAETGETLPFVNIAFIESRLGTTSDIDGNYSFETYYATDSIRASFVGYEPLTVAVRKDREQVIDLPLRPTSFELGEVVIKPSSENPAFVILRRLVANKPANNREKLEAYEYEAYNKVEFDLNNITEEFTQKKLFKPFAFIFDNIDSTDAKPYLPIFMTESLSNMYYRQKPRASREVIRGTKVSGLENESISQFMGDMYQNVNIYDNFLIIFGKNFVSPIADGGTSYYNYYLTDSAFVGRHWCYKLEFRPKRPQELAFVGEMWVNDTTYAVKSIEAGIEEEANLNFVQSFEVRQEYDQVEPEVWMLTRDELVVDLNIAKKDFQGIYGRRTATYKNFTINQPRDNAFYAGPEQVVVARDPESETEAYWVANRHVSLTEKEAAIYHMVDTMKTIPTFRTYVDVINLVVTGYYVQGKFELGPYFTTYSFNPVEGNRFRVGGRTSNDFSRRVELEGYAAYGTRDEEFKFGLGGQAFITKEPRQLVGAYYKRDIEQLGQSVNAFQQDNILSSVFRRNPNNRLTLTEEFKFSYEREWFSGFSNKVLLRRRELFPRGELAYIRFTDALEPQLLNSITTSEVAINTRFAFKEKFVAGEFRRVSLGTRYPALELHLGLGMKDLFGSDQEYQRMVAHVYHRVPLGPVGFMRYRLEAGRIWGTLPYPLLIIHSGNETFYNDEISFNTMNFFEFVSDRYISLMVDHHMDGFLFDKVPLFRRLKWREVLTFKSVIGNLDDKHESEMVLLPFMNRLYDGPFSEVGVGISNILKVLRVDGIWRLNYLDHMNAPRFVIRFKLHIDF